MNDDFKRVVDADSFLGLLVMTFVHAPDGFEVDILPPELRLNLESAFEELFGGLHFLSKMCTKTEQGEIEATLKESLDAYRAGDRKTGSQLLQPIYWNLKKRR